MTAEDILNQADTIQSIIDKFYESLTNIPEGGLVIEDSLDDTQVKIKRVYRSAKDIMEGIRMLEQQKNSLLKELYGNATVCRSINSMNR